MAEQSNPKEEKLRFKMPREITTRDLGVADSVTGDLAELKSDEGGKNVRTEPNEPTFQYIAALVGMYEIAFNVASIEGVIDVQNITPVPNVPNYILGICNVRGDIVSVVSLKKILMVEDKKNTSTRQKVAEKIILVKGSDYSVGFLVDAVLELIHATESQLTPVKEHSRVSSFARGLYERNKDGNSEGEVYIFDADALLACKELMQFQ
jgi:purine-binding chemotaxis protein CheW